jgi:hypothetical protein
MSRWKTHIKRDGQRTFCGIGWTVWRKGHRIWHDMSTGVAHKRPKETQEIPIGKYVDADCISCKNSFKVLAQYIAEENNLLSFFTLAQEHETRFLTKHKSVTYE